MLTLMIPRALAGMATAMLLAIAIEAGATGPNRFEFTRVEMGMPFKIILYAQDEATANKASEAAFQRIHLLDAILSDYKPDSELSRLSASGGEGQAIKVSEPLWKVLSRGDCLAHQTEGAFDVTVGPYVKLWRRARREKRIPSPTRMEQARSAVGYRWLRLDHDKRTAELLRPNMRLDLGGIAAGFAIDEALKVLKRHGVTSALIDASGDMRAGDPPPGEDGWRIGVAPLEARNGPPSRYISLKNAAVAASGDAWQFVEIDGKRYSHIVDTRTGLGLTDRSTVTVISRDGITADSLATAVCALGVERGLKLVESYPHAAAIIVREDDGQPEVIESDRFQLYLAPQDGPDDDSTR